MRDGELWPWVWAVLVSVLFITGVHKIVEWSAGRPAESAPIRICTLYVQEQIALCPQGAAQDTFVPLEHLREAQVTRDSALAVMQRALDWRQPR